MRIFANLFLVLFLADGSLSLLDDLLSLHFDIEALSRLRYFMALVVMALCVPLYICLGFDRRLPKRLFLPLVFFVLWAALGMWPLTTLVAGGPYALIPSALQVVLGSLALLYQRLSSGQSPLLTAKRFTTAAFSPRNTLFFIAGNLVVLPLLLVFFGAAALGTYIDNQTAGFVRLGHDGLYMTERVYSLEDKTVHLAGMVHIGNKDYYDELAGSIPPGRTIILAEGVTDQDNLLQSRFSYGKVADLLGLASQEEMRFDGRVIAADDMDLSVHQDGVGSPPDIVRADIDIRDFEPQTIEFINAMGKFFLNGPSFVESYIAFNAWAQKHMTPETNQIIMDDILSKRNREVTRVLEKALQNYDTEVIPWGALHMKGIEQEILAKGFALSQSRERASIDFRKIPSSPLFQRGSGTPGE